MATRKPSRAESAFPRDVARPAQRALASVGVFQLDQLTGFTEAQLRALHGMGPKAIAALKAALEAQGKSLAPEK